MNRIHIKILVVVACLIGLCWQDAGAIGSWVGGKVTKTPWREQGYLFISINNVKYTIMPEVRVDLVFIVNNATTKEPIAVSSLRAGDNLLAMAEGNRIYQIEKKR
jgi:hypothetical protein